MINTIHSIVRKSQRGIKNRHLSLLFKYGSVQRAPGEAKRIILTRKDVQEAISKRKKEIQVLSRLPGLTAITDGETVLTVYKSY